jgi:hypothetical protein
MHKEQLKINVPLYTYKIDEIDEVTGVHREHTDQRELMTLYFTFIGREMKLDEINRVTEMRFYHLREDLRHEHPTHTHTHSHTHSHPHQELRLC